MDRLASERWLGSLRESWPDYIWHYSDVQNIAKVLQSGRIYSRDRLIELGLQTVEIAQTEIIDQSPWTHPYARLYFRPVTPTLHGIEGIRRPSEISRAHCPAPVFLLFDSRALLTREDCLFTDKNFARADAELGDSYEFLSGLPFRDVYHDASTAGLAGSRKAEIIGARCAEVVFRDELDLSDLKQIVCRTPAERTTLLSLLGADAKQWRHMVRIARPGERIFFRDYAYVSEVRLLEDAALVEMVLKRGEPYAYEALIRQRDGQTRRFASTTSAPRLRLRLPTPKQDRVFVQLKLAGCLAYQGYPSWQSLF